MCIACRLDELCRRTGARNSCARARSSTLCPSPDLGVASSTRRELTSGGKSDHRCKPIRNPNCAHNRQLQSSRRGFRLLSGRASTSRIARMLVRDPSALPIGTGGRSRDHASEQVARAAYASTGTFVDERIGWRGRVTRHMVDDLLDMSCRTAEAHRAASGVACPPSRTAVPPRAECAAADIHARRRARDAERPGRRIGLGARRSATWQ